MTKEKKIKLEPNWSSFFPVQYKLTFSYFRSVIVLKQLFFYALIFGIVAGKLEEANLLYKSPTWPRIPVYGWLNWVNYHLVIQILQYNCHFPLSSFNTIQS